MLTTFRDLVWRKNEAQNLYGQAVFLLSTLLMCLTSFCKSAFRVIKISKHNVQVIWLFLFLRFYMTLLLQLGVYYACMCDYCAQVYTVQTT